MVSVLGSAAERIASHWRKGEVSGGLVNAPAASAVPLGQEPGAVPSAVPPSVPPASSAGIVTRPAKSWSDYLAEATAESSVGPSVPRDKDDGASASAAPSRVDEASRRSGVEPAGLRPPAAWGIPSGAQPASQPSLKKAPAKPGSGVAEPEQMQFEPVQRGHFQETSQTVIDGQDLDVPTFLRRRNAQK